MANEGFIYKYLVYLTFTSDEANLHFTEGPWLWLTRPDNDGDSITLFLNPATGDIIEVRTLLNGSFHRLTYACV
jgi:hypothetical protein